MAWSSAFCLTPGRTSLPPCGPTGSLSEEVHSHLGGSSGTRPAPPAQQLCPPAELDMGAPSASPPLRCARRGAHSSSALRPLDTGICHHPHTLRSPCLCSPASAPAPAAMKSHFLQGENPSSGHQVLPALHLGLGVSTKTQHRLSACLGDRVSEAVSEVWALVTGSLRQ